MPSSLATRAIRRAVVARGRTPRRPRGSPAVSGVDCFVARSYRARRRNSRAEVGRPVERPAVLRPADVAVGDGRRGAGAGRPGRDRLGLAGRDVDEMDVGLVDRDVLDGRDPRGRRATSRRRSTSPATSLSRRGEPGSAGSATYRSMSRPLRALLLQASSSPAFDQRGRGVPRAAVGEPRRLAAAPVLEEDLVVLGAPFVRRRTRTGRARPGGSRRGRARGGTSAASAPRRGRRRGGPGSCRRTASGSTWLGDRASQSWNEAERMF